MAQFLSPEEEAALNQQGSPQAGGDGSGFADDFSFSTDGLDSDAVERAGWLDKEGQYHFEIADVEFTKSKEKGTPAIELQLRVLHSIPGQCPEGTKFTSRHYLTDGTRQFVTLLGHRIGALKAVPTGRVNEAGKPVLDYVDAKTGSKQITSATWLATKGNQFVGLVKHVPPEGTFKEKYELVTSKTWPVDAEQVADVPKNLQAMKLIGKSNFVKPSPAAGHTNTTKPAAAKPLPNQKSLIPPAADDLSDL